MTLHLFFFHVVKYYWKSKPCTFLTTQRNCSLYQMLKFSTTKPKVFRLECSPLWSDCINFLLFHLSNLSKILDIKVYRLIQGLAREIATEFWLILLNHNITIIAYRGEIICEINWSKRLYGYKFTNRRYRILVF